MSKQTTPESSQRKLKLAEAGVLFVLILGLIIAVGMKMTDGGTDAAPVVTEAVQPAVSPSNAELAADVIDAMAEKPPVEPTPAVAEIATAPEPAVQTVHDLLAGMEASAVYREGETAYFARDYDLAADVFAEYVAQRPRNAWGRYMQGLSLWKAGDAEAAAVALEAAVQIKPDHVKSLINLARVNLELGRDEAALAGVEQALLVDPNAADGYRVLGRVYHALDRRDEAAQAYREALSLRGDDAWSLNNLGLVLLEQDRPAEALPALARAVSLDATQAVYQNNLGMALERAGATAQAAEAYAQAIEINGYEKAAVSLARVEGVLDAGGAPGESVDLIALSESFQTLPRIAAESVGNMTVVDHAPGRTTSAAADSAVTANTEVALGAER